MTGDGPEFFRSREEWRRWLKKNHNKRSEVWILAYKLRTGKCTLTYQEALDEALCYGWIDSRLRRIDDEQHMWRFAPRKARSIWSLKNRARAEQLIKEGEMTSAGLKKIEDAKRNGKWDLAYSPSKPPRMPKDLREALMRNKKAWTNFQRLAKSYRTTYIFWVSSARRDETRRKRIREVARRAARNIRSIVG